MRLHISDNLRIIIPLTSDNLITPGMEIPVRKQRCHLAKKRSGKRNNLVTGRVHGWQVEIRTPCAPRGDIIITRFHLTILLPVLDRRHRLLRRKFRIGRKHRQGMPWHIEFRYDPYPAISSISDDFPDLILGIILAVTARPMEKWQTFAFYPETCPVAQMPMQYVELGQLHGVQLPLQRIKRLEMA